MGKFTMREDQVLRRQRRVHGKRSHSFMLQLLVVCTSLIAAARGQRFMRSSGQAKSDAKNQVALADGELNGMARELYLMSDSEWEMEPPQQLHSDILGGPLQRHIRRYLDGGIQLSLSKKRGKYGLRAVGRLPNGKKLRAFWRQGTPSPLQNGGVPTTTGPGGTASLDLMSASYDEAVCRKLFLVEFEVVLPPVPGSKSKSLPSVVYQIPVEPGRMNGKSMVPRSSGPVKVFPNGHTDDAAVFENAGQGHVGMRMRAGLVDPGWAKGRSVFRLGRTLGLL